MPAMFSIHLNGSRDATNKSQAIGELLHGAFFEWVKLSAPQLANTLHATPHKPFTIWPQRLDATSWEVRLGILDSTLFSWLAERVAQFQEARDTHRWRIGSNSFTVTNLALGDWVSTDGLLNGTPTASQSRRAACRFLSPTTFRVRGKQTIFPTPEHVFGSLLRRWNAHNSITFPDSLVAEFESIQVSEYQLATQPVYFSDYLVIGFEGTIVYRLPRQLSEPVATMLHALMRFGRYSGVGYKTTMGLGRAEWEIEAAGV